MSKINEYPQAVTINNNDLFVIDQESGGDLSTLTTSDKSSLVGAVNEVAEAINSKQAKIKKKTVPITIGTSTYSDFLYADETVSDVSKDKIIGMYISGNPTNRPAFAILTNTSTTTIRLFANSYSQNTTFDVILTYYE